LNELPNPYQSPTSFDQVETWWAKLRRYFRIRPAVRKVDFTQGDPIICCGIAFFIDPANATVAYAASPSAEVSEQRMNLVVSESLRALPLFLADHPELHACLRGRRLTIRLIDQYLDIPSRFQREVVLEAGFLDAVLADP
jgi:hypothetical protein